MKKISLNVVHVLALPLLLGAQLVGAAPSRAINLSRSAKGWTAAPGSNCFQLAPIGSVNGSFSSMIMNNDSSDSAFSSVSHDGSPNYAVAVYNTTVDMGGANCFTLTGYNEDRYTVPELNALSLSNISAVLINALNSDHTYSFTVLAESAYWTGTEWVIGDTFTNEALLDFHGLKLFSQDATSFVRLPLQTTQGHKFMGTINTHATVNTSNLPAAP